MTNGGRLVTNEEKWRELIKDYVVMDACLALYGEIPEYLREKYANGVPEHLRAEAVD